MQLFADFSYWYRVKVAGGSFADFLEKATNVLMGLEFESFVCIC